MKINKPMASFLMVCAFSLNAHAVEIRGVRSCGKWIVGKTDGQLAADEAWLVGFLSGMAFESNKDLLKGTDNESIILWVNNFCKKNPLKDLVDASQELAVDLAKKEGIR